VSKTPEVPQWESPNSRWEIPAREYLKQKLPEALGDTATTIAGNYIGARAYAASTGEELDEKDAAGIATAGVGSLVGGFGSPAVKLVVNIIAGFGQYNVTHYGEPTTQESQLIAGVGAPIMEQVLEARIPILKPLNKTATSIVRGAVMQYGGDLVTDTDCALFCQGPR
jgi:hypothetical protein